MTSLEPEKQTLVAEKKEEPPQLPSGAQLSKFPADEEILKMPPNLQTMSAEEAADAFLFSEEFYVERALRVVSETFETRLRNHNIVGKQVLDEVEVPEVFLNITNIYDFNRGIYADLLKLRFKGITEMLNSMGRILTKQIPFFKLYTNYIQRYRDALKTLDQYQIKKTRFREFLELNELCVNHNIRPMLCAPVQRLPQYLVFLGSIWTKMDKSSQGAVDLEQTIRAIQDVTDTIAFALRDQVRRKLVVTVQQRLFSNNVDLIRPHRYVVRHGDLKIVYPKSLFHARFKNFVFILFNDFILVGSRPGKLMSGKVKHIIRLKAMIISDEPDASDYKFAFRLSSTENTKESHLICCPTHQAKEKWVEAIKQEMAAWKENTQTLQLTEQEMSVEEFENMILKKIPKEQQKEMSEQETKNFITGTAGFQQGFAPQQPSHHAGMSLRPIGAASMGVGGGGGGGQMNPVTFEWERILDPGHNAYYYEHKVTGESQWDPPAGWGEPLSPPAPPTGPPGSPPGPPPLPPSASRMGATRQGTLYASGGTVRKPVEAPSSEDGPTAPAPIAPGPPPPVPSRPMVSLAVSSPSPPQSASPPGGGGARLPPPPPPGGNPGRGMAMGMAGGGMAPPGPPVPSRPPPPAAPGMGAPPPPGFGGGVPPPIPPMSMGAPAAPAAPMAPDAPEAPSAPMAPSAPVHTHSPPSAPPPPGPRKPAPPGPPAGGGGKQRGDLDNTLKESLARYREFVQDEEDDIQDEQDW